MYQTTREVPPGLVHVPTTMDDPALRAEVRINKWSGESPAIPPIGSVVKARINRLGRCKVIGYFVEDGWLGLIVRPEDPPEWFVKQNGRNSIAHLFGSEIH